jgi:hypothetical protein
MGWTRKKSKSTKSMWQPDVSHQRYKLRTAAIKEE